VIVQDSNPPFFSVVLTTYNRGYCIEETLKSIFNQSFKDFEILVVDDCSTDDTERIVRNYDVNYYTTQSNTGGPAKPRNIGIENANGKWICFCDSDDLYLDNHLSTIYECIKKNNFDQNLFSTNAFTKKNKKAFSEPYFTPKKKLISKISFASNFLSNKSILSSLCIRNKDLLKFNEDSSFQSFEDYIFLLENILQDKEHIYIEMATIYYNMVSIDSIRTSQFKSELNIFKAKTKVLMTNKKLLYLFPLIVFCRAKLFLNSTYKRNS